MSDKNDRKNQADTALKERPKTSKPPLYKVVMHNDDYTTMEFVIDVLSRFFEKDESQARFLMLAIHTRGRAVVGVYPRDIAETKVEQVTNFAQEQGHPLLTTMEPE